MHKVRFDLPLVPQKILSELSEAYIFVHLYCIHFNLTIYVTRIEFQQSTLERGTCILLRCRQSISPKTSYQSTASSSVQAST